MPCLYFYNVKDIFNFKVSVSFIKGRKMYNSEIILSSHFVTYGILSMFYTKPEGVKLGEGVMIKPRTVDPKET